MKTELKVFTHPYVLAQIHFNIFLRFIEDYRDSLPPEAAALLTQTTLNHEQRCAAWAAQFRSVETFGEPLREALIAIDTLALPENGALLDDAVAHLPPGYVDPSRSPLHKALHLWLLAAAGIYGITFPIQSRTGVSPVAVPQQTESAADPSDQAKLTEPREDRRDACPTLSASAPLLQLSSTPPPQSPEEEAFQRLALLGPVAYDHVRRAEAKRLRVRLATLDTEVQRWRLRLEDDAEVDGLHLPDIEPWPEPITDAPELFDQLNATFVRHLYLPAGAHTIFTLWVPHSYVVRAFAHTPRLHLTSAEAGRGKSTAFELLAAVCPRVLYTGNLKPAALYRVVQKRMPTLLLDELDFFLHLYPELIGLLNAGEREGVCVLRCEGKGVRSYHAFAPAALAGLGHLPKTLASRCITIELPEAPEGAVQLLDRRHLEAEAILGRKLARWTKDNFDAIAACNPVLPRGLINRPGDKWRPLFALAQVIGGHWPHRAIESLEALNSSSTGESEVQSPTSDVQSAAAPRRDTNKREPVADAHTSGDGQLLADIRRIFAESGAERLFSRDLLARLNALAERPWTNPAKGMPLSERSLAKRLQSFGIRPRSLWIAGKPGKGYLGRDFGQGKGEDRG